MLRVEGSGFRDLGSGNLYLSLSDYTLRFRAKGLGHQTFLHPCMGSSNLTTICPWKYSVYLGFRV